MSRLITYSEVIARAAQFRAHADRTSELLASVASERRKRALERALSMDRNSPPFTPAASDTEGGTSAIVSKAPPSSTHTHDGATGKGADDPSYSKGVDAGMAEFMEFERSMRQKKKEGIDGDGDGDGGRDSDRDRGSEGNGQGGSNILKGIPKKPEEPKDGECCGNDCHRCVWIDYWEKLEEYNSKK